MSTNVIRGGAIMVADDKLSRSMVVELVKNIEDLPSLPTVVEKVIRLCNDPLTSAGDLEKVFQTDTALTGKVLRLVNSSYFALPHKVLSVTRAIAFLGFNAVKSIAMSISLPALFPDDDSDSNLKYSDLWMHSLATAETARLLAKEHSLVQLAEDAYITGLLHDIGKLIFQQFFHDEYNSCLDEVKAGKDLIASEREVFGVDHAMLGGYLVESWKFMQEIVRDIRHHHSQDEQDADGKRIAYLVGMADYYAHSFGIGRSGYLDMPESNPVAMSFFSIPDERLDNLQREVHERVSMAKAFIENSTGGI